MKNESIDRKHFINILKMTQEMAYIYSLMVVGLTLCNIFSNSLVSSAHSMTLTELNCRFIGDKQKKPQNESMSKENL